jgi:phosphate transport system substrate-binding protein
MRPRVAVALAAGLLGAVIAARADAAAVTLQGAGATFPAPLYYKWMEAFAKTHPDVRLSYDAVGSGDGVSRFVAGAVDFGASDAAPSDQDIKRSSRGALLVPATAGMVVLAYNLPGLAAAVKLPRGVYVDMLLGRIASWDDPRIQRANPDLKLPKRGIAVVARLDKSGTTNALTSHLSAISEDWKRGPGAGTWVDWPASAMLARGNEGVAARIKISEGAIGYVEYGFAKRLGLPMAVLENKAGKFVAPDEASGQSALAESVTHDGIRPFVTDPTEPGSYPVVTYSWLLLYKDYEPAKRVALKEFVAWGLTTGQGLGPALGYIPLPESAVASGQSVLDSIR